MNIRSKKTAFFLIAVSLAGLFLSSAATASAQESIFSNIAIGQSATRFAPGDSLPVAVVLSNYGAPMRIDVVINYSITNAHGIVAAATTETVAVETTSSYVRYIQIPNGIPGGIYTLTSTVTYPGQIAPATSNFRFMVEPKIFGIFVNDLVFCLIALILLAGAAAFVGNLYAKRRISRRAPIEYEMMPPHERIFYEITSDIIGQMRNQIGNKALAMANEIDGLSIDPNGGRVIKMAKDPSELIALLIYKYEKIIGRKITATPEPVGKDVSDAIRPVNQNLNIIEKYFNNK
jgi:hypothetical protein